MQPNFQPQQQPHDYGFIMQDPPKPRKQLIPIGGGLITKVLVIGGAILLIIVFFNVISNLVSPKTDFSGFVTIAEDQQEISHLLDQASQQTGLADPTNAFILTAQLGITNDQGQVLNYLSLNKQKVKPKQLSLKVSTQTDSELGSASTPAAYDSTFRTIIGSKLDSYGADLSKERAHFTGKKGQELLDKEIANNKLLMQKLNAR